MNFFRSSCAVPVAIGIMVFGLLLFMTRKINGVCFALFLICGSLVWLASYAIEEFGQKIENAASFNLKASEILGNACPLLLAASQKKTQHLNLEIRIKLISFATAIITFGTILLKVVFHLHGH